MSITAGLARFRYVEFLADDACETVEASVGILEGTVESHSRHWRLRLMSRRLSPRLASLALATAMWLASAGTAHACGVWSLRDQGHGWLVVFRSTAVEIVHHPEEKEPRRMVPVSAARMPSAGIGARDLSGRTQTRLLSLLGVASGIGAAYYGFVVPLQAAARHQNKIEISTTTVVGAVALILMPLPYLLAPIRSRRLFGTGQNLTSAGTALCFVVGLAAFGANWLFKSVLAQLGYQF